jgi:uncharacterized protein (TIGR04551 family)
LGIAALIAGIPAAHAQLGPGGGAPGAGGPAQPDKKEGVAEAAPKAPGLLPTTPALPAPKSRRKRWKLLELDGYYRMRTDWFKNFNLGFPDRPDLGGSPFSTALGCKSTVTGAPCDGSAKSANMRLRLEPTLNLDEGTSVHVQADLLDNLVLGSTPTAPVSGPPLAAFSDGTQAPVTQGVNSDRPAIQIKRAWGEVALPLGVLKFGRMPNQWGMGIRYNAGGADPINGGYDYDADGGDTVDRASFSLLIPGTNLRAMVATDWSSTRLASNQTAANKGNENHPYDLDDSDDASAWVGVISRIDSPQEFKDTLERGELALNYGAYFEYKTQGWEYDLTGFTLGGATDNPFTVPAQSTVNHYIPRNLKTYSPDVWLKLGYGNFTFEAEATGQIGSVDVADAAGAQTKLDIRKYGGSGRFTWHGLERKLRLGLEGGFATGDQWDNAPQGNTNIAYASLLGGPGDTRLTQFIFNREYKVDMILWRHLIGALTNAGYVKPFIGYDITKAISFKVANITSFALRSVATPGNSPMYGTEFNADVGYSSGGMNIGVAYGVLFPLGAMNHPQDTDNQKFGYTVGDDVSNAKDASTAHTLQLHFTLAF